MNKKFFIIITIFIFSSFFSNSSYSENLTNSNCNELDSHLFDCKKFECATKTSSNKFVKNKILGLTKSGKCKYVQYTENEKNIFCNYSEESRKFISIQLTNNKAKPNKDLLKQVQKYISQNKGYEDLLVEEIFINECKIK